MAEKDSGVSAALKVAAAVLLVAGVLYNFGFMAGLGGSLYQPKFFNLLTYLDFLEGMAYVLPTLLVMAIVGAPSAKAGSTSGLKPRRRSAQDKLQRPRKRRRAPKPKGKRGSGRSRTSRGIPFSSCRVSALSPRSRSSMRSAAS